MGLRNRSHESLSADPAFGVLVKFKFPSGGKLPSTIHTGWMNLCHVSNMISFIEKPRTAQLAFDTLVLSWGLGGWLFRRFRSSRGSRSWNLWDLIAREIVFGVLVRGSIVTAGLSLQPFKIFIIIEVPVIV